MVVLVWEEIFRIFRDGNASFEEMEGLIMVISGWFWTLVLEGLPMEKESLIMACSGLRREIGTTTRHLQALIYFYKNNNIEVF